MVQTFAPTIRAIETVYKGVRFRSRLEARWAVFFDRIGWGWDFEPEGYTDGKLRYLPDFWVTAPPSPLYWEVKRDVFTLSQKEIDIALDKAIMLAEGSGHECAISFGLPSGAPKDDGKLLIIKPDGTEIVKPWFQCPPKFLEAAAYARTFRLWDPR